MRDLLPFFDVIVLPTDAGPNDSRIELDGLNGEIRIYRLGILVGRWRSADFSVGANLNLPTSRFIVVPAATSSDPTVLFIDPPDSATLGTILSGQIFADLFNTDDTPYVAIVAPTIDAGSETAPRIDMYASNSGGSAFIVPVINIAPNAGGGTGGFVDIPQDTAKTTDLRLGNISLGRGLITGKSFYATANSSGISSDSNTDFAINNIPVIAGRTYELPIHSRYNLSAAGEWALELHVNGSKVAECGYINQAAGGNYELDSTGLWEPLVTATTDDVVVFANEISGASTLTFVGAANTPRWMTIKDVGER